MSFSLISMIVLIVQCICFIAAYELKYGDGYYRRELDGYGYGGYPMRPMGFGYPPMGGYPPIGYPGYGYGNIDYPDSPYGKK